MSLIVARKDNSQICIVSDTKLTIPNEEIKGDKQNPGEGLIKSVIINDNVCISFAGEVDAAEEALSKIKNSDKEEDIISVLFASHIKSEKKTEYIVCIGNLNKIIEIKNGCLTEVESSWIGDTNAFNTFQKYFLTDPKKNDESTPIINPIQPIATKNTRSGPAISITEFKLNIEVQIQKLFHKLSDAMDLTIDDDRVRSVGGFKVCIVYDTAFRYNLYIKTYRENFSLYGYGGQAISHGTSQEGAYTLNFIGSSSDFNSVALHIKQGPFGIVYSRQNGGLLRPVVISGDEIEFLDIAKDKYQIKSSLITEDRSSSYNRKGIEAVISHQYEEAIAWFEKAFLHANSDKERGFLLFNKGRAQWYSGDLSKGFLTINDAQKLNPAIFVEATKFINSHRPFKRR